MFRQLYLIILILTCFNAGICQTKETIDRNIVLIRKIYQYRSFTKQHTSADKFYKRILKLDTNAIPFLIEKIADTTQTEIINFCTNKKFKIGDIAVCLITNINGPIPWHLAFGLEGDSYSCGILPDGGWEDINNNRKRFQNQLKSFYESPKGKIWIKLNREKLSKTEKDKLLKELF